MNCKNCQAKIDDGLKFCISCGQPLTTNHDSYETNSSLAESESSQLDEVLAEQEGTSSLDEKVEPTISESIQAPSGEAVSSLDERTHSFRATWVLATFFGFLGADRFYLGHVGTGILKLIGFGWFGVWWLVDLMRINKSAQKDSSGKQLSGSNEFIGKARVISAVLIPIVLLVNIFVLVAVIAGLIAPTEA